MPPRSPQSAPIGLGLARGGQVVCQPRRGRARTRPLGRPPGEADESVRASCSGCAGSAARRARTWREWAIPGLTSSGGPRLRLARAPTARRARPHPLAQGRGAVVLALTGTRGRPPAASACTSRPRRPRSPARRQQPRQQVRLSMRGERELVTLAVSDHVRRITPALRTTGDRRYSQAQARRTVERVGTAERSTTGARHRAPAAGPRRAEPSHASAIVRPSPALAPVTSTTPCRPAAAAVPTSAAQVADICRLQRAVENGVEHARSP